MNNEQKQTLIELIRNNPAGAETYLESITNGDKPEEKSPIQQALEITKAHQEKLSNLINK